MTTDAPTDLQLPWMPEGRLVRVDGRGEFFVRHHQHADRLRPTVLLLHGWTASGDLQFFTAYEQIAADYSFIAIDHRGHGRGLRSPLRFDVEVVADDAVAVARELGVEHAVLIGYSMGGPISLTAARRHPGFVTGLVVQATALEWNGTWRERLQWRWLPVLGLALRSWTFPRFIDRFLNWMLASGHELSRFIPWIRGEINRGDAGGIVDAGRAISAFDATSWASTLEVPAASLITTNDRLVKPRKQRALAAALDAEVREIATDHLGCWEAPAQFASATVELLSVVTASPELAGSPAN